MKIHGLKTTCVLILAVFITSLAAINQKANASFVHSLFHPISSQYTTQAATLTISRDTVPKDKVYLYYDVSRQPKLKNTLKEFYKKAIYPKNVSKKRVLKDLS